MATTTATRRLAAILAADVVGYSRLMGADEEGTHERFKAHLVELLDPKIRQHHGRLVKTTSDGILAEFASVVDAVRCAGEIQRAMADRDLDLVEERRLRFRIGVNLGDVIADGGDIYGDGVNIAARLEGGGRTGRHLRVGHRPRPYRRPAPLRLRRHGRAKCQEHRAAGASVRAAIRRRRRSAGHRITVAAVPA
jgi:class 3 adenylate cyclase